jgi:hypothetical protein
MDRRRASGKATVTQDIGDLAARMMDLCGLAGDFRDYRQEVVHAIDACDALLVGFQPDLEMSFH